MIQRYFHRVYANYEITCAIGTATVPIYFYRKEILGLSTFASASVELKTEFKFVEIYQQSKKPEILYNLLIYMHVYLFANSVDENSSGTLNFMSHKLSSLPEAHKTPFDRPPPKG